MVFTHPQFSPKNRGETVAGSAQPNCVLQGFVCRWPEELGQELRWHGGLPTARSSELPGDSPYRIGMASHNGLASPKTAII